jgi:MtN3 and saliva related transmembrane protein
MDWVMIAGYTAAFCSTASFVPQAWQIIKTRDTTSISASTYALTCAGFALWLVYGLAKSEWPLVLTNAVCLMLSAFILSMKMMPKHKKNEVADVLDPDVQS